MSGREASSEGGGAAVVASAAPVVSAAPSSDVRKFDLPGIGVGSEILGAEGAAAAAAAAGAAAAAAAESSGGVSGELVLGGAPIGSFQKLCAVYSSSTYETKWNKCPPS